MMEVQSLTISPRGDERCGILLPLELDRVPFEVRRVFVITDVPSGDIRGNHAHKKCKQFLFCLRGEILVTLHDLADQHEKTLKAGDGILIDSMVWGTQRYITGGEILMVLCSEKYDIEDYIHDKEEFKQYGRS
jgi:dTDP-4-dehydrorhamnose 3,5-epimerase-like enzyme